MKRILTLLLAITLLAGAASLSVFAHPVRIVDESELISPGDEAILLEEADRISEAYGMDVVILTVDDLQGQSATGYADDFFDYNGYGLGESRNGILLLVSMGERDWAFSARGRGETVFRDSVMDTMAEQFVPYLSDGAYAQAFALYLEYAEHYLQGGEAPASTMDLGKKIMIALGLALVIAFVAVLIMKSKLNNATPQRLAHNYISDFNLFRQSDVFLYSHTTRVKRQTDSGGNSSGRTGSSGAHHSGTSGKF